MKKVLLVLVLVAVFVVGTVFGTLIDNQSKTYGNEELIRLAMEQGELIGVTENTATARKGNLLITYYDYGSRSGKDVEELALH
jgi:putative exporter of polyketide antibiotics